MMSLHRLLLLLVVIAGAQVAAVEAQSLQRLSVQGSGAVLFPSSDDPFFESDTRIGYEGQLRYTLNRLSVGAGYQRSTVYKFSADGVDFSAALSLGFVEPRYVALAGNAAALYLAGRLGYGTLVCSEECNANDAYLTYGGGGGILVRLTSRMALDLGGQYFVANDTFDSGYAMLRVGLGIGL
jgi:hypothetical protein